MATTIPEPVAVAAAPAAPALAEPTPVEPTPAAAAPTPAPEPAAPAPPPAPTSEPAAAVAVVAEPPAEKEAQTALTRAFTEAEWTALRGLRAELPAALAAARPEDADASTKPVMLYGVPLDPAHPGADVRASVVLMKFLRARNLNVAAAKEMLVATLRWRDEFGIEALMSEKFDESVFGGLAHITGKDRAGRPVTYNVYGANKDLKTVFGDVQRFIRWRVQFMEQSITQLDFENVDQMVQIHDYEGVGMSSRDANSKNAASELSSIFQAHYPEFLYRKFFVNVPSYMAWIFWIFKPLLSSATAAKMTVVGPGAKAIGKAILPVVEDTELPRKYGGTL